MLFAYLQFSTGRESWGFSGGGEAAQVEEGKIEYGTYHIYQDLFMHPVSLIPFSSLTCIAILSFPIKSPDKSLLCYVVIVTNCGT